MKYVINVHYDFVATVEVETDDEDQAMELAAMAASELLMSEMECSGITDICIVDKY